MANTDPAHTETVAQPAAHGEAHQPSLLRPDETVILWTWAIFFILLILLKKFAWGPILASLKEREDKISKSLDATRDAKEALENAQAKASEVLNEAQESATALIHKAHDDAASIAKEIEGSARKEAVDMVEHARKTIAAEQMQAIAIIRKHAAELAVSAASKLIMADLDDKKNRALVDGYINDLIAEDTTNG